MENENFKNKTFRQFTINGKTSTDSGEVTLSPMQKFMTKYNLVFGYLQIVNYAILVFLYLHFWLSPSFNNPDFLTKAVKLFMLEFLFVCASTFMAAYRGRNMIYVVVIIFGYLIYNVVKTFDSNYFFYFYMFTVVINLLRGFEPINIFAYFKNIAMSFAGVIFLVISIFISMIFKDYIPTFGITKRFLEASGFYWKTNGEGGIIVEMPQVLLFFWVLYFSMRLILAIYWVKWLRDKNSFINLVG